MTGRPRDRLRARWTGPLAALCAGLLLPPAAAVPAGAAAQPRTHVLIVAGLGGEARLRDAFLEWALQIRDAAVERHGVPAADVRVLTERPERDPRVSGSSHRENVEAAVRAIVRDAGSDDLAFIVLIGHGTFQAGESRINLPGPDLSAEDFAALLRPLRARLAFVNTTSASGEWVRALSGPDRAIVTATRSGMERNEAVFGRFFALAFASGEADMDRDGRVSLLEAYEYARLEVERFYTGGNRLRTEHSQLEDTGDGSASTIAGVDAPNGALAARIFLGAGGATAAGAPADASPELQRLFLERARIEERLAALRARREGMDPARYEAELERLLVELAMTNREIRRLQGGSP
jgi:hypothetical protein